MPNLLSEVERMIEGAKSVADELSHHIPTGHIMAAVLRSEIATLERVKKVAVAEQERVIEEIQTIAKDNHDYQGLTLKPEQAIRIIKGEGSSQSKTTKAKAGRQ